MTLHNSTPRKTLLTPKQSAIALAAVVAISTSTQAGAIGTPVSDWKTQQNTADAAMTNKIIAGEVKKQTGIEEKQLEAMGEAGSGMSLVNNSAWDAIGSNSEFYKNMESFGFDMCAINLCQVGYNPTDTDDIEEAREWAMKTFFSSSAEIGGEKLRDLVEVRRRALAYTSANGFALSTIIHNELASGGGTAQALDDIVDSSTNFRGDIQANSAIALAQYRVAVQQLAVLSAILDIEASQAISGTELFHEDGGTEFPDAYIESDFQHDGDRLHVTIPEKGSPD